MNEKEKTSMTGENDIVLIYFEDNPLLFARIESIQADHKKDWYQVRLLLLQIPLQVVTWILRDIYIDGQEFTMNGKRMRLEKVESPEPGIDSVDQDGYLPEQDPNRDSEQSASDHDAGEETPKGKVISLADRKPPR